MAEQPSLSTMLFQFCRAQADRSLNSPFIRGIAKGTLPGDAYKKYIAQDAFFLRGFARAYGAALSKAEDTRDIEGIMSLIHDVQEELKLHAKEAERRGIDMAGVEPNKACKEYLDFLLRIATSPLASVYLICAAMAPCMRLYAFIGQELTRHCGSVDPAHPYHDWISLYSSESFEASAKKLEDILDRQTEVDQGRALRAYRRAMELEYAFFLEHADPEDGEQLVEEIREKQHVPRVLIIAGSDSGGGAGIQADIKACEANGAFSMTAITALTAQNTQGVQGIFPVPHAFLESQITSCLTDIGASCIKTGMLPDAEAVRCVVQHIKEMGIEVPLVVDPVMVAASGDLLVSDEAVEAIKRELIPLATIITPNLPEAAVLLGHTGGLESFCPDIAAREAVARRLCDELGCRYVLLKGGHCDEILKTTPTECIDILYGNGETHHFPSPWIPTKNTHGTGCTLASAIASWLASHLPPERAVKFAKAYIQETIAASAGHTIGEGSHGPLRHSLTHLWL